MRDGSTAGMLLQAAYRGSSKYNKIPPTGHVCCPLEHANTRTSATAIPNPKTGDPGSVTRSSLEDEAAVGCWPSNQEEA